RRRLSRGTWFLPGLCRGLSRFGRGVSQGGQSYAIERPSTEQSFPPNMVPTQPCSGGDSSFLEPGGGFTADSSDHRQQAVGRFILRNESIHRLQCGFRNRVVT